MNTNRVHNRIALSATFTQTSDPCILRKELLRKTSTELIKQCKKCNISTSGNKGEIADRLVSYYTTTNCTLKSPKSRVPQYKNYKCRKRRNTIAETLSTNQDPPNSSKLKSVGRSRSEDLHKNDPNAKRNDGLQHNDEALLDWIKNAFKEDKYQQLKDAVEKYDVKCSQAHQITDLTLKILGFSDKSNRKYVMHEIENVSKTKRLQTESMSNKLNKEKQFRTEINRLRRQIAQKDRAYADLKKRFAKISKHAVTTDDGSKKKAKKIRNHHKTKKKNDVHKKNKAQLRYDQDLEIKIEGLAELNQFLQKYEKEKHKSEDENITADSDKRSDPNIDCN